MKVPPTQCSPGSLGRDVVQRGGRPRSVLGLIAVLPAIVLASASVVVAQATLMRVPGVPSFGWSLAAIGDIDRDGFSDVVATNPWESSVFQGAGSVTVLSSRTGAVLHTIHGPAQGAFYGFRACDLGDVDGDRVPDFAFSATYNGIAGYAGVWVISGRTFAQITAVTPFFDRRLLGKIDVDGDGVRDLVMADSRVGGDNSSMMAYSIVRRQVLWGSPPSPNLRLGEDMRAVPDRDNDGVDDILVSAGRFEGAPTSVLFLSGRTGQVLPGGGGAPCEGIASLPDMDGDGRPDFAIGGIVSGRAWVEVQSSFGGRILYVTSPTGEVGFGSHLSPFMDFDRDGRHDILVASSDTATNRPKLHIVSGRDGRILHTLVDTASVDPRWDGLVVADVNGDGTPDILTTSFPSSVVVLTFVTGSYAHLGTGCRGAFGELSLRGQGVPRLGQPFSVVLSNVAPLWGGVFYIGASDQLWGSLQLPVPLDQIGMTGCTLYVSGDVTMPWLPVSSIHPVTISVPPDPAVLNARFFNQAFQLDLRANPLGIVGTNAGVGTIGGS